MTADRTRQLLTLPDGRTLCFAAWGEPEGFPVVAMHRAQPQTAPSAADPTRRVYLPSTPVV